MDLEVGTGLRGRGVDRRELDLEERSSRDDDDVLGADTAREGDPRRVGRLAGGDEDRIGADDDGVPDCRAWEDT